jgi:hypothetical protein
MRLSEKSLKHAENGGFMTKNVVFYKMMGRRMRGIAKIPYGYGTFVKQR